jgi:AraC-like DNA-binding protein
MIRLRVANFIKRDQFFHFNSHELKPLEHFQLHTHDFHELFWVDEGIALHSINGERRDMPPGMLAFIRAPDGHNVASATKSFVRIVNIAFRVQTWDFLRRRYFQSCPDVFGKSHASAREFTIPAGDFAELRRMGRELGAQPRERLPIERFLVNLVVMVNRLRPVNAPNPAPDWLQKACREIGEGRNFEHGTAAFARLAGKSPEHVAREVRRCLGKTPTDIVNDARLAYAASRLAMTSERIVDIALDCGFENLGHFYKLVQKKFGVSPREYRLQQQRIVRPG